MTQKKKTDFKIVTPPDDLSEVRAKTKKIHREKLKKIVVPVILIALAVSGTYLMLTNKAYSEAGTAVRYSTDSSDTSNYAHFANGIVRYNRDGVVFLNKKNEEKWIQSTQLKNPIIEVKEKAFAVGDIGGNSILVFSEEGLKGEIETSLPIENMAISDQGIVTVLLKNETAPKIISYDAMGNVLVEQQVTVPVMGYPVAMDMSDDGKMLAVTYFHTDDAVLKSKVIYYNFGESGKDKPDKIVASDEYSDTIMADIFFMGSDRSVVVGDNSIVIYKGKAEPKKEKEISIGQEIQSVFHSDQYIGLILLSRITQIYIYDGLESIGDNAFMYCSSLSKIRIPDSVEKVGQFLFLGAGKPYEESQDSAMKIFGGKIAEELAKDNQRAEYGGEEMQEISIQYWLEKKENETKEEVIGQKYFDKNDTGFEKVFFKAPSSGEKQSGKIVWMDNK